MSLPKHAYFRHRFPGEIISRCVWLYFRFGLNYLDVEEMMAERGVSITYESVREWCLKFGGAYARRVRSSNSRSGDHWYECFFCAGFLARGRSMRTNCRAISPGEYLPPGLYQVKVPFSATSNCIRNTFRSTPGAISSGSISSRNSLSYWSRCATSLRRMGPRLAGGRTAMVPWGCRSALQCASAAISSRAQGSVTSSMAFTAPTREWP